MATQAPASAGTEAAAGRPAVRLTEIRLTVIPVALAQRLMRDTGVLRRAAANVTEAAESAQVTAV